MHRFKGIHIRDDLCFEFVCSNKHITKLICENQKFEILFDMAISALLDGYGREAVSTFAAAQERFHEFCIQVFLANMQVNKAAFRDTWKHVVNQSERQLGAYYFLYLVHFNTTPASDQGKIEFRNKVIHNGLIPTPHQAEDYAEYIYNYIVQAILKMRPKYQECISEICNDDIDRVKVKLPSDMMTRSVSLPTAIWLSAPENRFGKRTFQELLRDSKDDHKIDLESRLEELDEELNEAEDE
jgi:hypothetical protein